jgi:hypothetical protein
MTAIVHRFFLYPLGNHALAICVFMRASPLKPASLLHAKEFTMRLRTALLTLATVGCVALPLWAGTPAASDSAKMCHKDKNEQAWRGHERAPLTPAQEKFVNQISPLRDSLHLSMRDYSRKAKAAGDTKGLTAERARIGDLKKRIESIENDNLEVWLTMPHGPRGEGKGHGDKGGRGHGKHNR